MCTLTLAWRVFADAPVVVAANRDESADRPSEPPTVREGDPAVLAPRDARAGGTWIGRNDRGVVAAVTNRWLDAERDPDRSRGLLVGDCLGHESAEDAVAAVERELAERAYDGFHLVVADDTAAFLLSYDGRLSLQRLDPGVHVVVNVGGVVNGSPAFTIPERAGDRGGEQAANARTFHAAMRPEPGEGADSWLDRAAATLGDHEYGLCVHGDGFGTRSSSLVKTGVEPRYAYADGPPCETAFEPVAVPADWDRDGSGGPPRGDDPEGHL